MALQSTFVVLDGPPRNGVPGLKMTAKRYTTTHSHNNTEGLTLLFTHCVGSHKEQWEPVIERIFEVQQVKDGNHRVREAWSLDWQSHGDAAVINHEALANRSGGVSVYEWARAITAFLRSSRIKGHRVVAIGHSAGATALMLTMKEFSTTLPYAAMVLVEPSMITRELFNAHLEDRMSTMNLVVGTTAVRRDTWASREAAFAWFSKRFPWNFWESSAIRILVNHGLRDAPPNVTLKCDRNQEAMSYPETEGHFESTTILGQICHTLPVHVVWGSRNDLIPEFIQQSLSDANAGRIVASVTKVKGAGHMIVQEQPDRLAQSLCGILDSIRARESTRSRL